ncbi:hypothetical protein [Streptomyces sp. NPDC052701]
MLLKAVENAAGATLSPDQYQRTEAIGSALHYGEFAVDRVRFLVESP